MHKKITKTLLLITLLVLLIGITSAATVTDNTTTNKVTQDTNTAGHPEVQKNNEKIVENKIIKKENKNKTIKTARKTIDITEFNTLHNTLTSNAYDSITLNIKSDIILSDNTELNEAIKTLSIDGDGKTINGNRTHQFLSIKNGQNVTINNLRIINCSSDEGGAINNENGNLTITHSTLNNNTANTGGAIFSEIGNLTITDSTLTNNNAFVGGAIYLGTNNLLNMNNSVFINNTADYGGAIYGFDGNNYANINNSYFANNTPPPLSVVNTLTNTTIIQDKFPTRVSVNLQIWDDIVKVGNEITIEGTLEYMNKWNNWDSLSDMNITIIINGKKYQTTTDYWGEYHFDYITETSGINNVIVIYEGNYDYYNVTNDTTFEAEKNSARITLFDIDQVKKGDEISIEGYLLDENDNALSDMNITIIINGKEYQTITDYWGGYHFDYVTEVVGTNNVTVIYEGNAYYNNTTSKITFKVKKIPTNISVFVPDLVKTGNNLSIYGYLKDDYENWLSNVNITLLINDKKYQTTTDDWGNCQLDYLAEVVGTNNVTVIYEGNNDYENTTTNTTFEVTNTDGSDIFLTYIGSKRIGDNINISGYLESEYYDPISNTFVILNINGELFNVITDENGYFSKEYTSNIVGTNNITAYFQGNDYYRNSSCFESWEVTLNYGLNLNIESSDFYVGDIININGVLTNNSQPCANANVNILLLDNYQSQTILNRDTTTDENGIFNIQYTTTTSYNNPYIRVSFIDELEEEYVLYKYINIRNLEGLTLNVNNSKSYYIGEEIEISGKLTYKDKNVANTAINLSIYEETREQKIYDITITTDENGNYYHIYKIPLNLTIIGNYKIKVSFNDLIISERINVINKTIKNLNILNVSSYEELLGAIETINHMADNVTINLLPGDYHATGTITFNNTYNNKNITINGNNNILNGNDEYQFIHTYYNITLKNMKLINFKATHGGAISNYGNLIVINCTFEKNHAEYGGVIYSTGELTISNSFFINNTGSYGGTIYANTLSSTINGEFMNNIAIYGGAIYGNISNSIFNGNFINNAAGVGGAIYGNISNSIFNGNFENTKGGTIHGNVTDSIFNGDFINNTARTDIDINNIQSFSNENINQKNSQKIIRQSFIAPMTAGVITGNVGVSTFNGNFIGNTADLVAIINGNVDKSVFTGNFEKNTANEKIIVSGITSNSVFSSNIVVNDGEEDDDSEKDKLFAYLSNTYVGDRVIAKTEVEDDEDDNNNQIELTTDFNIYVDGKISNSNTVTVSVHIKYDNLMMDKTIEFLLSEFKNVVNPIDGPLGEFIDGFIDEFAEVFADNIREKLNNDKSTAALIVEIKNLNNLKDATEIANFYAHFYGPLNPLNNLFKVKISINEMNILIAPGIYRGDNNKGLKIYVYDLNYALNLKKNGYGDVIIDAENNGAIITAYTPKIIIDGLTFMHASNSAIIFENGLIDSVINANFIDNHKSGLRSGGAIYSKDDIYWTIFYGTFTNNTAGSSGGAIYCQKDIRESTFNSNFINNKIKHESNGYGGAICCENIIDSTFNGDFIDNYVESKGGAIECDKILFSTFNSIFENNKAGYGGAISCYYIGFSTINNDFINNSVEYMGGAIYCDILSSSTFNGTFAYNTAQNDGGAIYCHNITLSTLNATFIYNTAKNGGAIYSHNNIIYSTFNGTFAYNTAQNDGGAIFCHNITLSTLNATFIYNTAKNGGAIYCHYIALSTLNSKFSYNRVIHTQLIFYCFRFGYKLVFSDGMGGAISCLNIIDSTFNCEFISNNAKYGGAIYCNNIQSSIFKSHFINNSARYGGAIYYNNTIQGSTFNCDFINNYGCRPIHGDNIQSSTFNCIFNNNTIIVQFHRLLMRDSEGLSCDSYVDDYDDILWEFNSDYIVTDSTAMGELGFEGKILDIIRNYYTIVYEFSGIGNGYGMDIGYGFYEPAMEIYIYDKSIKVLQVTGHPIRVYYQDNLSLNNFYVNQLYPTNEDENPNNPFNNLKTAIKQVNYVDNVYITPERYGVENNVDLTNKNIKGSSQLNNILAESLNEFYVNQSASTDGDGSINNPFNNLKSAIEYADNGDNIYIASGTYAGENNIGLSINKSLNLVKYGVDDVIFDAQNSGRIFTINVTSFNITGLTFVNATDTAITFNKGLMDSKIEADFKNNKNKSALYIKGPLGGSFISGEYINNTSKINGGAIRAENIINSVINTNFTNNKASNGGAIAGNIIGSTINGNFNNNTADNGGAIFGNISNSLLNTKFTNNTADMGGGAIYGNISRSNFTNDLIENNALVGGIIYGSVSSSNFNNDFLYNHAINGGVIYGSVSNSNFTGKFINNNATKGSIVFTDNYITTSTFDGKFVNTTAENDYGKLFYADNIISDSKFLGEIFVSNLDNINTIVYSSKGIINCIFNNSTYEDGLPRAIDDEDINIPSLDGYPGETITVNLPHDASGTLTLNVAGKAYIFDVASGVSNIIIPDIAAGNYDYILSYSGNNKYLPFSKTGIMNIKTITKTDTKITLIVSNSTPLINTSVTITATLTDTNNNKLANQNVTLIINNKSYNLKTNNDGRVIQAYTPTTNESQTIIVKYNGDKTYNPYTISTSITAKKINTNIVIKISNTVPAVNDVVTVSATLTDANNKLLANKNMILRIDNKDYALKTNNNGTVTQSYSPTSSGVKNISVKFNGDNIYNTYAANSQITVNKINTKITLKISNTVPIVNNELTITATLTDTNNKALSNQNIILTIDGKQYTLKSNTQGTITQTYTPTTTGTKTITAKFNQDNIYKSSEDNMKLNVVKSASTVTINSPSSTSFGDTFTINVTVKDQNSKAATGNVTIKTGNTTNTLTLNDGQASLSTSINTTGKYDIITTYNGNEYNLASSKTTSITVTPAPTTTTITVTSNTAGNVRVTGTVKDKNGRNVNQGSITMKNGNNNVGSANLSNGAYNILTTISSAGNYQLTAQYMGTKNYLTSFANINTNVALKTPSITATVNGNKIGKTNITATLKDPSGTGLKGVPIIVTLPNGTQITGITNNTGVVNIAVDIRENGTITIKYPGNNTYKAVSTSKPVSVTKNNPVIKLNPVKGVIGEDITLTAYLTDADGTPITGGNLAFKLNGKTLRSDGRFDSKAPAMKFSVKNGLVTYTIKADLYLRNAKNLTASYSGTNKYVETESESVTAQIQKRYANITVTATPTKIKHYETLTIKVTAKDTTKNGKNQTLITDNTKVMLKINGVTLKDNNGKRLYVPIQKDKTATYQYTIPRDMGGITSTGKVRNYPVTAIFVGDNYYPGAKNVSNFQVERSSTNVTIQEAKVTSSNVLSVKASLTDFKGNYLKGTNKVTIKINGKNYVDSKNGKAKYWSVKNGVVNLTDITVDPKTTIKRVMLVTGERQAYTEGRAETTNIIRA